MSMENNLSKFRYRSSTVLKYADFIRTYNGQRIDIQALLARHGLKRNASNWKRAGIVKKVGAKRYFLNSENPERDALSVIAQMAQNSPRRSDGRLIQNVQASLPLEPKTKISEYERLKIEGQILILRAKCMEVLERVETFFIENNMSEIDEHTRSIIADLETYEESKDAIAELKKRLEAAK